MKNKIFEKGYKYKSIKTRRLLLIKPSLEYAKDQLEIYEDKKIQKYNRDKAKITLKETIKRIKKKQENWKKRTKVSFMIVYNNKMIGYIGTYDESKEDGNCYLGYAINSKYWNQGFMSETIAAFVKFIFENTTLFKISGHVCTTNKSSIKVLEKNKFKQEGCLKKSCVFDNKVYDDYIYSIIDYKKIKEKYS